MEAHSTAAPPAIRLVFDSCFEDPMLETTSLRTINAVHVLKKTKKPSIKRRRLGSLSDYLSTRQKNPAEEIKKTLRNEMVRLSRVLLSDAKVGISKTLSEILVCPLSKQPLRVCEESGSLFSDAIGVSYPVVDGIPSLVPKDGKILATDDIEKPVGDVASDSVNKEYECGAS